MARFTELKHTYIRMTPCHGPGTAGTGSCPLGWAETSKAQGFACALCLQIQKCWGIDLICLAQKISVYSFNYARTLSHRLVYYNSGQA